MPPPSPPPPTHFSQLLLRHQSGEALSTKTLGHSGGTGLRVQGSKFVGEAEFHCAVHGRILVHAGFLPALTRLCQEVKSHCLCTATIGFS